MAQPHNEMQTPKGTKEMMINKITSTPFTSRLKKLDRALEGENPNKPWTKKVPETGFTADQIDSFLVLRPSEMKNPTNIASKIMEYEDAISGLKRLIPKLETKKADVEDRFVSVTGKSYDRTYWQDYFDGLIRAVEQR